ncbi:hypothetical protein RMCBS344292_09792 [Rhizopus microsporus]|nr:hypothetical protein RMCBS344292_09792 [Rhizopus microsporus]
MAYDNHDALDTLSSTLQSSSINDHCLAAKPIEPAELGNKLNHIPPPLMIDMRPLVHFEKSHIRHSINLDLPTLLIKRYQRRGNVAQNFNLENFITTHEGINYFKQWIDQFSGDYVLLPKEATVVVYDDHMVDSSTCWTLMSVILNSGSSKNVYWLHHGFSAFRDWDTQGKYLSDSPSPAFSKSTPTKESGTPMQRRASLFSLDTRRHSNSRRAQQDKTKEEVTMADDAFIITEVVSNFLYLGSEITSPEQLDILKSRSIRRILNMAEECDDDIPGLKESFVYCKIPARDMVEMKNVQDTLRTAVQVINTARRHHEPVYVHCKAGKSRSVAVILAYLVLSEKWTLKRAYQLIVKERPGVSPNIGFVAELLKLEHSVHGKTSNFADMQRDVIRKDTM